MEIERGKEYNAKDTSRSIDNDLSAKLGAIARDHGLRVRLDLI